MKRRAAKISILAIEVIAVLLAVAAATIALLIWRLQHGPVSLSLFKASAEFAIERNLPEGFDATIGAIALARDGNDLVVFQIDALDVEGPDGERAASAPNIEIAFSPADALRGKIGPRTISADGAYLRVVRNERNTIEISGVGRRRSASMTGWLNRTLNRRVLKRAFESAVFDNATIEFFDVASERSWSTDNGKVELRNTLSGVTAEIVGDIAVGEVVASLDAKADYVRDSGVISLMMTTDNVPAGDVLFMFYGEDAAILNAPLSGDASIAFDANGAVLSSHLEGRVGAGELLLGDRRAPIEIIEWDANFDPSTNKFEVDQVRYDINGNSGTVRGDVEIVLGENERAPMRVLFDLAGEEMVINAPGVLQESLPVDSLSLAGAYDTAAQKLAVTSLSAALLDIVMTGDVSIHAPPQAVDAPGISPGIVSNISIDGELDPERLLRLWPVVSAMGARDWVKGRLKRGTIENIKLQTNIQPGMIAPETALPNDALNITFDARDITAYYAPSMTPIVRAAGSGVLNGNRFSMKADRGQVGNIAISKGEVEFPEFIPRWGPSYYRFTARGKSEEILAILDQKPLRLLQKTKLTPDQFLGDAVAEIEVMRPNKREVPPQDYNYSGKATFENMLISGLAGDVDFDNAKGVVDLKDRSLTVTGGAFLSDAPIDIVWRKNFYQQDGPSTLAISGTYDSATGDLFGLSSRQYLHGPVVFAANATGELGAFETLNIDAKFDEAALAIPLLGWRKPAGTPANGALVVTFVDGGADIEKINLTGDGLNIEGTLGFAEGGLLKDLAFDRFFLEGAANFTATAQRSEAGPLELTVAGDYLNAAPLLEGMLRGGSGDGSGDFDLGAGLLVNARIETMGMRRGVEHSGAALEVLRTDQGLEALSYTALDHDGPPLTVNLVHGESEGEPTRTIEARSNNVGAVLAGVFGMTQLRGGEGELTINLSAPGETGIDGVVRGRDMRIVNAPLLTRIFAAGSLTGLADLLNNEGIELEKAYGEFYFRDGVMNINEARATGPSLGITTAGDADFGADGEITLAGALAPLYQVNSILGAAPIIGDILVGKEGEGVFALSYQVSGETAAPSVSVNPLSAVTPGIFRNLFDPPKAADDNGREEDAADEQP